MEVSRLFKRRNGYITLALVIVITLFGIKINNRIQANAAIEAENKAKIAEAAKKEEERIFKQDMRIAEEKKKKHTVSSSEFGNSWPFNIDSIQVDCVNYRDVIIRLGSTIYALNGKAKQRYPDPEPIMLKPPIPTEIIQKGLSFCPE